ncbi:hypothetical protein BT96DRAFT_161900 [Gymnopus androsaceus JB14]|uniref:Uncharacterized protein n=1 Tax=Gymnopus androsaceus JB14 TaxID=1447944 RepID=A0A6A4HA42_9AGAR|nr:hypothetical protein BT96DRAFT_161900 [Gymnopus androsaceus JB14]
MTSRISYEKRIGSSWLLIILIYSRGIIVTRPPQEECSKDKSASPPPIKEWSQDQRRSSLPSPANQRRGYLKTIINRFTGTFFDRATNFSVYGGIFFSGFINFIIIQPNRRMI